MKSKLLIGIITFFAAIFTCILILNFSTSSSNKNNYFERIFSNKEILKLHKEFDKLDKNSMYELFYSNTSIIEGKPEDLITEDKKSIYNLYFSDCTFSNKKKLKVELPINSNILYTDRNTIIYSLNSKNNLYKLDLETNETFHILVNDIDISFMISLDESQNKYLFFGEILQNNIYKTGFFIFDIINHKITETKLLQSNNKSYKPEVITMYSGYFQKTETNSISYTCDKNSKIFLFNDKGNFEKVLNTKDNTALPKVIKNSNNDCFYSRAGLRFTNSGIFMDKKNIYVFSMASKFYDKIIIDQYSKANMKYIQSYYLNYNSHNSKDIVNVIIHNDEVILKFAHNYASFKFSRYID